MSWAWRDSRVIRPSDIAELHAHVRRLRTERRLAEAGSAKVRPGSVVCVAVCASCGSEVRRQGYRGPWLHTS